MKKSTKITLSIAGGCIAFGTLLFGGVLIASGGDLSKLETGKKTHKTYGVAGNFSNLKIDAGDIDVHLVIAKEGEGCKIDCDELEKVSYTPVVEEGTLKIVEEDTRKWWEQFGLFFGGREMTVYLPQETYETLTIEVESGDVFIPAEFTFTNADISATSGDVKMVGNVSQNLSVEVVSGGIYVGQVRGESISVQTTSGDVALNSVSANGKISVKSTSGDLKIEGATCGEMYAKATSGEMEIENVRIGGKAEFHVTSGDIDLDDVISQGETEIRASSGNIRLTKCDAASYVIHADSGNVTGNILSSKIFQAKAGSGNVRVPDTTTGGVCKVTTGSGNIKLSVVQE